MRFHIVINSSKTIAPNKQTGTAKNIQILFHKKINTIFHNTSTESQFLVFSIITHPYLSHSTPFTLLNPFLATIQNVKKRNTNLICVVFLFLIIVNFKVLFPEYS